MKLDDRTLQRAEVAAAALGLLVAVGVFTYAATFDTALSVTFLNDAGSSFRGQTAWESDPLASLRSIAWLSCLPAIGLVLAYLHTAKPAGGAVLAGLWGWVVLMFSISLLTFLSVGVALLPSTALLFVAAAFGTTWSSGR